MRTSEDRRNLKITGRLLKAAARHHSPCVVPGHWGAYTMASYFPRLCRAAVTRLLHGPLARPGLPSQWSRLPKPCRDPFLPELLKKISRSFHKARKLNPNPLPVLALFPLNLLVLTLFGGEEGLLYLISCSLVLSLCPVVMQKLLQPTTTTNKVCS